jgi:hypothetical protein
MKKKFGLSEAAALMLVGILSDPTVATGIGSTLGGNSASNNAVGKTNLETKTELTTEQLKNIARFEKKLPANAKNSITTQSLPNGGVAAQATSPGKVPGSSAVYEKQVDVSGNTIQYTKTTYDPAGNIVHVKDKITGGVVP